MKEVYYIGFYCGMNSGKRKLNNTNPAGTLKMQFIIRELKKLGYKVTVVSIAPDVRDGFCTEEKIIVDSMETHIYLPSLMISYKGRRHGTQFGIQVLKRYLKKNLKTDDIVVSYHSLGYSGILSELHKNIKFRWIPQIEEIYCLSRGELKDKAFLEKEVSMFADGDAYLFVNDLLPMKYSKGKPYAVSYGNYQVYSENKSPITDKINIVYTGIINDDRGAFMILEAMRLLPSCYRLNVLGFGTDANMKRFLSRVDEINGVLGEKRICFYGTRSGEEYSRFLVQNQIGISLMDPSRDISSNAFPSKIMAYLGHALFVVSSKTESIQKSKVANMLFFCDNTPESIADTIKTIPLQQENKNAERLGELERLFAIDLRSVIEG